VLFEPRLKKHEAYRRRIWMRPEVHAWVQREGTTPAEKRYYADVRAFLKGFVIGEDFEDDALFKLLSPPNEGVFEFRVTFQPAERLFGAFVRKGEFVITNRKDRKSLGKKGFAPDRGRCRDIWASLFPNTERLTLPLAELLEDF
jgi:hypothetical protein